MLPAIIKYVPYLVIAVLLTVLFLRKEKVVTIEIPAKEGTHTVERPDSVIRIDTVLVEGKTKLVEVPNPVNKELLKRYRGAKDSLEKERLHREAITERTYKESFVDSTQTITVTSEVIGTLKSQKVEYRIPPSTVEKTVNEKRLSLFAGLDVTTTTTTELTPHLTLASPKVHYRAGYNLNRKAVTVGISIKLF